MNIIDIIKGFIFFNVVDMVKMSVEIHVAKFWVFLDYREVTCCSSILASLELSHLVSLTIFFYHNYFEFWLLQYIDWDSGRTHIYHCHVSLDGSYRFKVCFSIPLYIWWVEVHTATYIHLLIHILLTSIIKRRLYPPQLLRQNSRKAADGSYVEGDFNLK